MKTKLTFFLLTSFFAVSIVSAQKKVAVLEVPGLKEYCRIDSTGVSVLPSGRYVTPAGQLVRITHDPFGLAVSPDGKKAVTLHNGVVTLIGLQDMSTGRIPPYGGKKKKKVEPLYDGAFLGVA